MKATIAAPLAPFEPSRGRTTEPLNLLDAIRRFGELCAAAPGAAEHGSPQEADEYDRQATTLLSAIEAVLAGVDAEHTKVQTAYGTAHTEVEHLVRELGELLLFIPPTRMPVLFAQWREQRAAAGSTETPAWARWDINADTPMPSGAAFLDLSPAAKRLTGWQHAGGLDVTHRCGACGFGVHWSTRRQWEHITPAADGHTPACGTTGPGGVTCSAPPSHGLAHWSGGVRTTTWTDRDMPTPTECGSHSGRYPNLDGVYCTLPPDHDGPHRTRRDEHEWAWSQSKPGMSSLHGRHMCGVVDFVSEVRCGRTRGHDGDHAVDEPPVQRASGGPVPSGQTVTIGPAEPPPLPKRVKGTHGPTPEATRCPRCGSDRWVSVSLDEGFTRRAQCVPCGHVHAKLGPGWRAQ